LIIDYLGRILHILQICRKCAALLLVKLQLSSNTKQLEMSQ
jgi:hypothetical protein